MPTAQEKHYAAFERPLEEARTRAEWWFTHYWKVGGVLAALAFESAAVELQLATSREAAARRLAGLP